MNLKNRLPSIVTSVRKGRLNTHIGLQWGEIPLSGIVTTASAEEMGLDVGDAVEALFKASDVILARGLSGELSARNLFPGRITALSESFPLAMVHLDSAGCAVRAEITQASLEGMGLKVGDEVQVVIKSTELILAKKGRS